MLASFSIAVAAWMAGAAPPQIFDAGERVGFGLILVVPSGRLSDRASRSEIIRTVDAILRESTSLRVLPYEEGSVAQQCPNGTITCFVDRIASVDRPRHLLILSLIEAGTSVLRAGAALVDCPKALALIQEGAPEEVVARDAIRVRSPQTDLNAEELAGFLRRFFDELARPSFEEAGVWKPYGAIDLSLSADGLVLELDGRALGAVRAGTTRIERVSPGRRELSLSGAGFVPAKSFVEVKRGEVTKAEIVPLSNSAELARDVRTSMMWGGMAVAAIGAGIVTYALVASPERLIACPNEVDCGGGRFLSTGSAGPPKNLFDDASGGIAIAPAGFGLIAGGTSWAILAAIDRDSDAFPIFELAIGAVAIASTYAVSAIAGGP